MMLIFGLMLLLLQTAACLDRFCRFNQSDPCYAALGHILYLQMVRDARDQDLDLYKEFIDGLGLNVFKVKNNKEKKHESIKHRSEFIVHNGTLIINNVIRADLGNYRLDLYRSDGSRIFEKHLHVNIEGPPVALIVLGCFAVILIILVAIAYYIYKKKNRLKTTANVENASTDPQTNRNEKKEQELHYEEITFTSSNIKQQLCKTQEECVYAQVQMH